MQTFALIIDLWQPKLSQANTITSFHSCRRKMCSITTPLGITLTVTKSYKTVLTKFVSNELDLTNPLIELVYRCSYIEFLFAFNEFNRNIYFIKTYKHRGLIFKRKHLLFKYFQDEDGNTKIKVVLFWSVPSNHIRCLYVGVLVVTGHSKYLLYLWNFDLT